MTTAANGGHLPQQIPQSHGIDLFNPETFATMQRVCKMYASSELVPDMYKATSDNPMDKAIGNCMIAIEIAHRIGASPLMVMQNMVPIYGKPSWSSKFLIATVNACGRFNPLKFRFTNLGKLGKVKYTDYVWNPQTRKKEAITKEFDGTNVDNMQCVAYTSAKGSEDVLEGTPVSILLAIQEGWYTKNGSKWQTMSQQMLTYRAASFWTSAYAPELSMGIQTQEEVRDIIDATYEDVTEKILKEELEKKANSKPLIVDDGEPVQTTQTPEPTPEPTKAAEPAQPKQQAKQPGSNGQATTIQF